MELVLINSRNSDQKSILVFLSSTGGETAWDMLHKEQLVPRITTSCADLDNLLGGGINSSEVTEIG